MQDLTNKIKNIGSVRVYGEVTTVKGLLIECLGLSHIASVGAHCKIINRFNVPIKAEVVGVDSDKVLLMPFSDIEGVGAGCKVWVTSGEAVMFPHQSWLGRVISGFAEPLDNKGPLPFGEEPYRIRNTPPQPHKRTRVEGKIDLGVRSINTFTTCCRGQRMGIFAGSGVGKSMLLSMITKYAHAPIKVIGLIGERGREVQEFIEDYLGEEGMKQAIIIVATSDESALMRKQAAYLTLTTAEYFRDQGHDVLCMMDSVTRFAMAQREIGLSAGEPPTSKGYTPTVFAELPKLLERAGPGSNKQGSITGLFTVLVEGDDHNEPISDAVRGILDGHIVLDRHIAERGRFPAVNVLRSISRTMPQCNDEHQNTLVTRARALMSTYDDMAELIRLGAYRKGSSQEVDEAILYHEKLESFLQQKPSEKTSLQDGYIALQNILDASPQAPEENIPKEQ